jgi:hypothetical protein
VIERDTEGHFLKNPEFINFIKLERPIYKKQANPEGSYFNFWRKVYFDFRLNNLRA